MRDDERIQNMSEGETAIDCKTRNLYAPDLHNNNRYLVLGQVSHTDQTSGISSSITLNGYAFKKDGNLPTANKG